MLVLFTIVLGWRTHSLQKQVAALQAAQHTPDDDDYVFVPCTLPGCTLTFNHAHC